MRFQEEREGRMQAKALAMLALALLPASPALAADSTTVTLVTPVVYGTHLPGLGEPAARLGKLIRERSGGSLGLDLKEPGEGTKPQEILDKLSSGSVDAGFATASYWTAKIPAAALFAGFPFGPDGKTYLDWFETGNGSRLYQEMYDQAGAQVHVMPCAFGGAEAGGWFAKEIKTADDIKGLRMRIFGLGGRVMSKLGATTVIVPGGNLVKAFDRGDIDAAELYTPAADREQDLKSKVKLIYVPGWHQPETVLELLINKDRWNGLTAEQRSLIEGACHTISPPRTKSGSPSGPMRSSLPSARPGPTLPRMRASRIISSRPFSTTSRNSAPGQKARVELRTRPRRRCQLHHRLRPRLGLRLDASYCPV
jgi:TRAP-type mannitol/chloroaromatic compound transport system substrate-binding protein